MSRVLIRRPSATYVFMEKNEKYQYFSIDKFRAIFKTAINVLLRTIGQKNNFAPFCFP